MRNIKTFEGFFDFFKKKKKLYPVKLSDIRDCLLDLTDEDKILNSIEAEDQLRGKVFVTSNIIFGKKSSSLEDDHEDLMNDALGLNKNEYNFEIKKNVILFKISYHPYDISDEDVSQIISEFKDRMEYIGCKVTYFLAIDYSVGGGYTDKEWLDFNDMIKDVSIRRGRNITVKVLALGGIERN